ncbi:MAG TPA: hypothetical protein VLQ93_08080 [Myxococcaceae bacterium]|nr:hypothetical protein [Myxococcaceae bacterium]
MAGNLKKLAVCAAVTLGSVALAQEEAAPAAAQVPTSEEAKRVVEYYLKGQGQGPVLLDAKLCAEVSKSGENKFECIEEVPAEGVKANSRVTVWQAYMLPQGDTVEDIMVQVKHGEIVRETKDVKVTGGLRTRSWPSVRLNKSGDWSITILRGEQVLKKFDVKVL